MPQMLKITGNSVTVVERPPGFDEQRRRQREARERRQAAEAANAAAAPKPEPPKSPEPGEERPARRSEPLKPALPPLRPDGAINPDLPAGWAQAFSFLQQHIVEDPQIARFIGYFLSACNGNQDALYGVFGWAVGYHTRMERAWPHLNQHKRDMVNAIIFLVKVLARRTEKEFSKTAAQTTAAPDQQQK